MSLIWTKRQKEIKEKDHRRPLYFVGYSGDLRFKYWTLWSGLRMIAQKPVSVIRNIRSFKYQTLKTSGIQIFWYSGVWLTDDNCNLRTSNSIFICAQICYGFSLAVYDKSKIKNVTKFPSLSLWVFLTW